MTCNEKGIFSTTGDNQLSVWTEKFQSASQSHTCTKKSHGHCLVICCPFDPYSFLNPSKTITSEKYAQQIDEMLWKLQCLKPTWVNRLGPILLMTTPNRMSHNQHFKSWMNWATTFCLIQYIHLTSHQPTTSSSTSWHLFARKTLPQPTACRKCFPRVHQIWGMDFYDTGINKFISYWQKVVIVMVPILFNKDVFEPSYNDLKFMVWNRNYICTNLILLPEKWHTIL